MKRQYSYVGDETILHHVDLSLVGTKVLSVNDVRDWIRQTKQELVNNQVIATFVVNLQEELLINDRHSEHVMCAGGSQVLSAGEITFEVTSKNLEFKEIEVIAISNQSTGYCPEPNSWQSVAKALQKTSLVFPDYFTSAFEFRYCLDCKQINLVKDQLFECVVCGNKLDKNWNLDQKNLSD